MNTLRSKYKKLRAREIDVKKGFSRAKMMPTLQVISWLDEVENLRNQAKGIEKSPENRKTRHISAYELSRKMDQHQQAAPPLNSLTVQRFEAYVDQCPQRSDLLDVIWENLIDFSGGIISIYGYEGVGKTTAMTEVGTLLLNSGIFDSVITVSVSEAFSLHKVQNDIALQMNLDLPAHNRAAVLLAAFQKSGRYLIIFDDLWEPIPLLEVGIPHFTRDSSSKIVLISRNFEVCPPMKPNKVIRIDPPSRGEKWDMFVEGAGNTVVAPKRSNLLGTIWENLMDPSIGVISIYGYEGVGKTTGMKKVITQLSKYGIFDSIITVVASGCLSLNEVHSIIAQQMNLDLPYRDHDRAAMLFEAFQKNGKIVIIFDDFMRSIPFFKIGIPRPNRGNSLKIIFISRTYDVCSAMKPDKVIRIDPPSRSEKWDMFLEDASNTVLAPERSKLLGTIWENLMDPSAGIISIYGHEGVGKTTAMTKVRTQLSESGIFDSIITLSMSKRCSFYEVQSDIALRMNVDLPIHKRDRAAKLLEVFHEVGKFVIIIDDLWEPILLPKIGIPQPDRGNGSKIVLISRSFEVCSPMMPDKAIRIDPLSWCEKWDMFVENAGNTVLAPEINPFAKLVVDVCPNLPLMVTMIGHAMRNEPSLEVWRNAKHDLCTFGHTSTEGIDRFCYSRLNNETVQNCFLYCALFPQGHLIKSDELIKYWIGESFIRKDGNIVTEIESGSNIIRELVDANMLEMFTVNEDDRLKMPRVCRNVATDIMKKEPGCWVIWNFEGARKVSMIELQLGRLDACPPINCVNLSTILASSNPILYVFNSYFCQMHSLSLLDLSRTCIEELPQSLSNLVKLHALFLQDCGSLSSIPSLKEMRELQIINLSGTSITELPEGMEGMFSLRSLNISETTKLENIRVGLLSSLSGLEELLMQGSGLCKLDSPMVANYLMEMRYLKRLAILKISTAGCDDLLDTVVCLQQQSLQIYSINFYGSSGDYSQDS